MSNKIDELRKKAVEILSLQKESVELNQWGHNIEDLIQELGIYHIELEHQNAALEVSERETAKSQAEYVELFENAPVGYVIIDNSRKILKVNQTYFDMYLPYSTRSMNLEGQLFDEYVCPEFRNTFVLFCTMIQKTGIPVSIELKIFDRFYKQHYVLVTAGERGENARTFRLAFSDIAMQKTLESQLVRSKERAEENDRRKSLFLSNVSQELRTALTSIVGFGDMLEDSNLSEKEQRICIGNIQTSTQSLLSLIDEILDLSSLESGEVSLREENVDIAKICDDMTTLMQKKVREKGVLYRQEMHNIPTLLGDPNRLRQIILGILEHTASNASEGDVLVQGEFELEKNKKSGVLKLTFSGKNIFSGESSLEMDVQRIPILQNGGGLRLYFAKQLLRRMHGEFIWVHPLDSLRIEIPMEVSPFPVGMPKGMESEIDFSDMESWKKCLLVDNIPANLDVLSVQMKKLHYQPVLASSGKEALEILTKQSFDLILTDLWMPDMSGEELAMQIRRIPEYDEVPIVAVTADVECAKTFDMTFFKHTVFKPTNLAKLQRVLDLLNEAAARRRG